MAIQTRIATGADYTMNNNQIRIASGADYNTQSIYTRIASGADYLNWQRVQYLVRGGVPQVGWSLAEVEVGEYARYTLGSYGLAEVRYRSGATQTILCAGVATDAPVNLAPFSTITFVFTKWSRDASKSGYYHTNAGVYGNRVVGKGGSSDDAPYPTSMLRGWKCNDLPPGSGTYSFNVADLSSGYVGIASGGGYAGHGGILVSDVYLT